MREIGSAALRRASPTEREAWREAFGEPPRVPRQRGERAQTRRAAWQMHQAYMGRLGAAFAQSYGRTPTGQQSHVIPLLSFAEGRTRRMLTQTAQRVERYWEIASWVTTTIHLPTLADRRKYASCHDAAQQADQSWDSALEALETARTPVERMLHPALRAARGRANPVQSNANDAFMAVVGMVLDVRPLHPFTYLDYRFSEAKRQSFDDARRDCQAKLLAVQDRENQTVIAAYNDALETVATTLRRFNAAYTSLWQQGERIVVLLQAKGEYLDPNDHALRLRGREAQARGIPVLRVTFERSKARERLLQTAGQAYHDHFQTDAFS